MGEINKKKYFLVLDTETANSVEEPLPYDIGYVICDRLGKIYVERSFVVAEVFLDLQDVMKSAYYAEKIPNYWEDIKNKKRFVRGMWDIRRIMLEDMKQYNVKTVCAYNMNFDRTALNNLIRYVSKSWKRYWFPWGIEYNCIWNMACNLLLNRTTYVKFALNNGLTTECGNLQTSAEACYKYIKNKVDFVEEHTGLEDVKIEVDIMAKCFAQHKKVDKGINRLCWKVPQQKRKMVEV